jgi:hypothetical protein
MIDTIEVNSRISNVNVFFEGARVTRKFQSDLAPGKYTLSIEGLPLNLDQELIQVKSPRGIKILTVSHKVAKPSIGSIKNDLNAIVNQRELLEAEIEWLKAKKEVFSEEEAMLTQNTELKQSEGESHVRGVREAADFFRERLTEIARLRYDNALAIRKAQKKLIDLNTEENRLKLGTELPQTQLFVLIEVNALNNGKMQVEYFTEAAGWEPLYDLRFEEVNKPLQLVYNANVFQSTGENWDEVDLSLTEGLPKNQTSVPHFKRWYITKKFKPQQASSSRSMHSESGALKGTLTDAETAEALPFVNIVLLEDGKQITGSSTDFDGKYTIKPLPDGIYDVLISYVGYNAKKIEGVMINKNKITFLDIELESGVKLEEFEVMEYSIPLIDKDGGSSGGILNRSNIQNMTGRGSNSIARTVGSGTSRNQSYSMVFLDDSPSISSPKISYSIGDKHSIKTNGKDILLTIKTEEVPVEFLYRAIPKVDTDVYLVAKITDWGDLNLLSGKSTIYFQGAYTSESRLEAWSVKDTLEIALGSDDQIFLERKLNEEMSKKQTLGNKVKQEAVWEITARNNKNHPIKLELIDQIPLSDNKSISVEPMDLGEATHEVDSGKLVWEMELKGNTSKKVSYGYELKYPETAMVYN